jgi:hypothetical protein
MLPGRVKTATDCMAPKRNSKNILVRFLTQGATKVTISQRTRIIISTYGRECTVDQP